MSRRAISTCHNPLTCNIIHARKSLHSHRWWCGSLEQIIRCGWQRVLVSSNFFLCTFCYSLHWLFTCSCSGWNKEFCIGRNSRFNRWYRRWLEQVCRVSMTFVKGVNIPVISIIRIVLSRQLSFFHMTADTRTKKEKPFTFLISKANAHQGKHSHHARLEFLNHPLNR